jgi:hypothetical protein
MSTTHQDKSSGKPRKRSRKADQRGQKPEQPQSPKLDRQDENQISPMVASTDALTDSAVAPAEVPSIGEADMPLTGEADMPLTGEVHMPLTGEVLPPDVPSIGATAPADYCPTGIQAIANAYADYTMKSFEENRSFVGKLIGVRSLDQAIEVQTEFARQAYANFVAESQKICELYGELARQIFRPWERFSARVTQAGRQIS